MLESFIVYCCFLSNLESDALTWFNTIDINYENDLAFPNRLIESEALRTSPIAVVFNTLNVPYLKCLSLIDDGSYCHRLYG